MTSASGRACRNAALGLLLVASAAACGNQAPAPSAGAAETGATPTTPLPVAPSPSAVASSPTVAEIARLQARVKADAADPDAQRDLGFALLQRVRETADPSLYAPALTAFEGARLLAPDDPLVYVGLGGLQLGKHQFADALASGHKAIELGPTIAAAHAVVVDALVELGRYDEADAAAGVMLGIRADLSTLARASYLAELRGKLDVALSGMRQAAQLPGLAPENSAYVKALLGNLLVYTGDGAGAAEAYRDALALVPNHAPSLAGEARLAVAAGKLDDAIALFQQAADVVPLPEYVLGLGETQAAAGRAGDAKRSFELAAAEIQLFRAAGVVVDVDLALFEADHGDPTRALDYAEAGYRATPTVRAADAVAWALHRLGRDQEARQHSAEALRLGSRDPLLRYHAGAIAASLGDTKAARLDLEMALDTDAGFSATGAAEARRILDSLPR